MRKFLHAALFALAALTAIGGAASPASADGKIRIFAAASTTTAVQNLIIAYQTRFPDDQVVAAFAASSTLAKQVANGAPTDVFLSASRQWMDFVVERGAVNAGSVVDLLGNRLVLIAPAGTAWTMALGPDADIRGRLNDGYLAMGDPDHVPAGLYGKEALTALGLWPGLSDRVARAANVRAALVLVERGEAAAGVVYATDAAISDKVRIVATFPKETHTPIVYPAALVSGNPPESVRRFFEFLRAPEGASYWKQQGFFLLDGSAE